MVVIAILALLAALLFPVFAAARERARQATCASNLKQIGAAVSIYAEDWDGNYFTDIVDGPFIYHQLAPYLNPRNQDVWICPDDPAVIANETASYPAPFYQSYNGDGRFFGFNEDLDHYEVLIRSDTSVKDPSGTIMFLEGTWGFFPSSSYLRLEIRDMNLIRQGIDPKDGGDIFWYTGCWHQNRGNYLFADGHVRILSIRQTLMPKVLWSRISEWCPECVGYPNIGPDWTPESVQESLSYLDELHYP